MYVPIFDLRRQYDGDKWDAFYEDIPISLLHHTNGNGIYSKLVSASLVSPLRSNAHTTRHPRYKPSTPGTFDRSAGS